MAARVARTMVVYARRNGDEPQASAMLRHRGHLDDTVHRVQDVVDARFTDRLPLTELARAVGFEDGRMLRRLRARNAPPQHASSGTKQSARA